MVSHLLSTTWRNLMRHKANTSLHVVGLTLGITVCLLIALFIHYELSFDGYHAKAKQTFRLVSKWTGNNEVSKHFSTPFPLANAIRTEASGFEHVGFFHPVYVNTVEVTEEKRFLIEDIVAAEPDLLQILSFETVQGNLHQTLQQPYQAALTESTARKMFGTENPIGKTFKFKINDEFVFTVTALIKDLPANTHLKASMFVSYSYKERFLKDNLDGWTYVSGTEAFITIPSQADTSVLMAQLKTIANKYINAKNGSMYRSDFILQPLQEVHFAQDVSDDSSISASWLWFFGLIGMAVLILACINFVNLSTAQALTRAREVGIRKSIGAGRGGLITQFLIQAWVLTFVAGVLAVACTQLLLPYINTMMGKGITFDLLNSPLMLITLMMGLTVTGLLAGIYPAWMVARFNPTATLKVGVLKVGGGSASRLRKGLVVTQFAVSACLIMAVILMAQQVDYLRSKNLGFNKDNVVLVDISNPNQKAALLSNELSGVPSIAGVSFSTSTPSSEGHWATPMSKVGRDDPGRKYMALILADDNFAKLYQFTLLAGRLLLPYDTSRISKAIASEERVMNGVVNEQLIRELGFESNEAAIGQRFYIGFNEGLVDIVGVVADFNHGPLSGAIKPVLITSNPNMYEKISIKIEAGSNIPKTLAAIESAWKKTFPESVFTYKFLDEQIDAYYNAESRLFSLFKIFAGVAMLISCLGLFGLAAFTAQNRVKEIGIRKVLGATVNSILILVSKDFLKLVLVALLIATPLAWYGTNQWLSNYAYHITVSWWAFVLAGGIAVLVTIVTVSTQAFKAAWASPVDSLKTE